MTGEDRIILAHTRLDRDRAAALACAPAHVRALPYAKRLALPDDPMARARTLAGVALARLLLAAVLGRAVAARELSFPQGMKPSLPGAPDFSISHSGTRVGCALAVRGRIGLDIEEQDGSQIGGLEERVAREAALKALGLDLRAMHEVHVCAGHVEIRGRRLARTAVGAIEGCTTAVVSSHAPARLELRSVPLATLM